MNVNNYFNRIGIAGFGNPDISNLKLLHKKHLLHIPFENLDIRSGKEIVLSSDALEKKILDEKRGGYCYELNGMFYILLKSLGYKVKMISARVNNGKGGWGAEYDHLAIVTEIDGREFLTDVGFGDNFFEPLEIVVGKVQKDRRGYFKIEKHDNEYLVLMKSGDGIVFSGDYIFTLYERKWNEFQGMNKYHQTSPESHFTQGRICSIATDDGRISLSDSKLTVTKNGEKVVTEIADENDFKSKLFDIFGISL